MFRFFSWGKQRIYKEQTAADIRAKMHFLRMSRLTIQQAGLLELTLPTVWDAEARRARRADRV